MLDLETRDLRVETVSEVWAWTVIVSDGLRDLTVSVMVVSRFQVLCQLLHMHVTAVNDAFGEDEF